MYSIESAYQNGQLSLEQLEREGITRVGVILVCAAYKPQIDEVSVYLLSHKPNERKNIKTGDLGFPSETAKVYEDVQGCRTLETPVQTLMRLTEEELCTPIQRLNLHISPNSRADFRTNASGLSLCPDTLAQVYVLWTAHPGQFPMQCNTDEIISGAFYPILEVISAPPGNFRTFPSPQRLLPQLQAQGFFIPPTETRRYLPMQLLQHQSSVSLRNTCDYG
jgi:hypothetical protein